MKISGGIWGEICKSRYYADAIQNYPWGRNILIWPQTLSSPLYQSDNSLSSCSTVGKVVSHSNCAAACCTNLKSVHVSVVIQNSWITEFSATEETISDLNFLTEILFRMPFAIGAKGKGYFFDADRKNLRKSLRVFISQSLKPRWILVVVGVR